MDVYNCQSKAKIYMDSVTSALLLRFPMQPHHDFQ